MAREEHKKVHDENVVKAGLLPDAGWAVLAIPEGCKLIFVCTDPEIFDKRQLAQLYDGRNAPGNAGMQCFIGYLPGADLKDLDKLAGIPKASPISGQQCYSPDRKET